MEPMEPTAKQRSSLQPTMATATTPPRLLDRIRIEVRRRHMSLRTEEAHVGWARRYVHFHGKRHPLDLGEPHVEAYLTHLAVERRVARSTQNQALHALRFLYDQVLHRPLASIEAARAKKRTSLPAVLSSEEMPRLFRQLDGVPLLVATLLYGSGLRLLEALRLRVQDLDFHQHQIRVRAAKGDKQRITMLPRHVEPSLRRHLAEVQRQHEADVRIGAGDVYLPNALERKYPNAAREWCWQYVFPSGGPCRPIHAPESDEDITSLRARSRRPSSVPYARAASAAGPGATPSVTASRPTSFRTAMTSAPFKSSWGTPP
jgi:integron integrase